MFRLAFRSIFRQTGRTAMTLVGIIFGVVGMILAGGFVEDIFYHLQEFTIHSQLGHVQVHKAGFSGMGQRDPYEYLIADRRDLAVGFEKWPEVLDSMARVAFSGLANNGRSDFPVMGEGVEPDREARLGSFLTIVEGRQLQDSDQFGILLGKGVARTLNLKAGDPVTLLVTTPGGALNSLEFTVVGVFQSFSKDFDDRAVRIPLTAAQELLNTSGILSLVFSLRDTQDTDTVASRLREQLPAGKYEVKPWYELAEFYQKTVELYRRQFGVLQLIILAMVLLGVANSVNMAIYERTGEFGTLMALGNRRRHIFRMLTLEYAILGLIGAALGVALGLLLSWSISRIGIPMPPLPGSDAGYTASIRVVPSLVASSFLVGFVGTVLAVLLPARRASRTPVVDALRANI